MYLLDSNVLIEAKNRYYAFDLAPGFWTWLERAHRNGVACSIEPVHSELVKGNDDLAQWAADFPDFSRPIDQGTVQHFPALSTWATSRDFTQAAINAFTGNHADYLLVAYARQHQHTVVTHERSQPASRRRILIPDACTAMAVSTVDTFEMLRSSGARFELAPD